MSSKTTFHYQPLSNSVNMHYADAGSPSNPALLLLHGYPSSSHQFRHLIPRLNRNDKYRIIAPDLPSFGLTALPANLKPEDVTFDYLASSLELFVDALKLKDLVIYIFDFGAPTGLRLAQKRPELVRGIITQNGNAYMEGIGPAWDPLRAWWKAGKNSEAYGKTANTLLDNLFTLENTKKEYIDTVPDELRERFDPYTWQIDYHLNLATREGKERKLSLFWDYQNNLARYPDFQDYFRKSRVPILAVWGRHDTYFPQQGAEAFRRDSEAEVRILDGGHFLLETHMEQVAEIMEEWLNKLDK